MGNSRDICFVPYSRMCSCSERRTDPSAGLYAGVSCTGEKLEKAQMIYEQLLGAITAKKYFDVKFNIANSKKVCCGN